MLLFGPAGSGKTPFGDLVEQRGLWCFRWVHFDFVAQISSIAADESLRGPFGHEQVALIYRLLVNEGPLEKEHFPLAERILRSFLAEHVPDQDTCVVLNGLPSHVHQTRAIDAIVEVHTVLCLRCTRETALNRVRSNVDCDLGVRCDGDPKLVAAKLEIFRERTKPIVQHYRSLDVPVRQIVVTAEMTPDDIWRILQHRGC
jgi:adenylate kinase